MAKAAAVAGLATFYFSGLNRWPYWTAELWTVRAACGSFSEMLAMVAADKNPPLFYAAEWLACHASGSSEWSLRFLPAIVTLLAVIGVFRVARRVLGGQAGWVAGAFVALSPYTVVYAQTARPAPFSMLAGVGLLAACIDLADGRHVRRAIGLLGFWSLVGMYTHYGNAAAVAGAGLAAGAITLLAVGRTARQRLVQLAWLALSFGLAGLGFLPWEVGAMTSQGVDQDLASGERTLAVFHYLLWPAGPNYQVGAAYLLAGAAGLGWLRLVAGSARRAVLVGWAISMVAVPWLWSSNRYTLGKFYIYAGLMPVFALSLAAAAGPVGDRIDALWRRVSRRDRLTGFGVVAMTASIVALVLPGTVRMLRLPSSIASVNDYASGVWDVRADVALLSSVAASVPIQIHGQNSSFYAYSNYLPELTRVRTDRRPVRPGSGAVVMVQDHSDQHVRVAEREVYSDSFCVFSEAFAAVLSVNDPLLCGAIARAIDGEARASGYGPFLVEVAANARRQGDLLLAEDALRRALESPMASTYADMMLVDVLSRSGRYSDAVDVIDQAIPKAARFGEKWELLELVGQKRELARAAGLDLAVVEAQFDCVEQRVPGPLAFLCTTRFAGRGLSSPVGS